MKSMKVAGLEKMQRNMRKEIDDRFHQLIKGANGSKVYGGLEERRTTIYDGCLDVEKYLKSSIHVMWILKEHNEKPNDYADIDGHCTLFGDSVGNPSEFKKNVSKYRSLRLIERGSRYLLQLPDGSDPVETFRSISAVNLGKCPGENKTPDSRLDDLVHWWGKILTRQVFYYKPDMIIVPGSHFSRVMKHFSRVVEKLACNQGKGEFQKKEPFSEGKARAELYANEELTIIHMQHPSWFGCKEDDWMCVLSEAVTTALPHLKLPRLKT